jgi:hypothetical protein
MAIATPVFAGQGVGGQVLVHGLWVWKTDAVLDAPGAAEALRDFCRSHGINEVYLSASHASDAAESNRVVPVITLLHRAGTRVEALLSSTDADEPGPHRDALLLHAEEIIQFNQRHPAARFDGIHLDIEPQQRPENKGSGNLQFLPGLTEAFRAVRQIAEPAGLTVNADIQEKLLKGDITQRQMLLSALPRVTLMMYELNHSGDGSSDKGKADKVVTASQRYLDLAYGELNDAHLARMAIALRTPDYGEQLPQMLNKLDDTNRDNPHYLGWAWHSYNDVLKPAGE